MVDNCYGIFTEKLEPTQLGADLIVGSLIKNAGGGIARTGGYIAGRRDLIEQCAYRLTTPGQGKEIGCTLGELRNMFLGLFLAPNVVCNAVKTAIFAASLFERLGFRVTPSCRDRRTDIIQSIELGSEKGLVAFCKGIQRGAPVDSFVVPEPWDMPGYENKVVMAAGAFHLGASIELSADGRSGSPTRPGCRGGLLLHRQNRPAAGSPNHAGGRRFVLGELTKKPTHDILLMQKEAAYEGSVMRAICGSGGMADALVLGTSSFGVWVRPPSPAPPSKGLEPDALRAFCFAGDFRPRPKQI